MKVIIAAGVATVLAIGSLGYIAGAKSASSATTDPFAVSAFEQSPAPAVTRNQLVARPAPRRAASPPVSYEPAPVVSNPTVIRETEPVEPKRSWKKTAIVIGAGAGSGAVVGGIIDGKKGAGIGAAIGGGAASVYEVLKRR
jgi:hypothetical protein